MGHRALTRQKRKCRPARQRSMTMLTMQVRAMTSCTGRSMTRKGKATMAPPMPLTPDTKPPAIQARNTQISVIPGIRPSCGHGRPHQCMKSKRRCRSGPSADSGKRAWRMAGGASRPQERVPSAGGCHALWRCRALQGAACRAGRLSCGTAFSHQGDCLRELPAPRSPARVHSPRCGPRTPCLGGSRPFGNREPGEKTGKSP